MILDPDGNWIELSRRTIVGSLYRSLRQVTECQRPNDLHHGAELSTSNLAAAWWQRLSWVGKGWLLHL
jgi:hypothetical protein